VWNKAYNISVQMAAVQNKYITILDALDYAQRVEASRPNNVSMIYQIGSIYYDKLGGSQEKEYYRTRVREESKPHAAKQKLAKNDPGWRRLELDPVLDAKGMILPELLKPKYPRPATLPAAANGQYVNGAELQFLEPYQPFPYGVSTMAFGYNYHKQAQLLQTVGRQLHANLSETVLDSRPALALKGWSEEEWERGRRSELKALNAAAPGPERGQLEMPTAAEAVTAPISDKSVLNEAIYDYDLAARLSRDAYDDYARHVREYAQNYQTYQSHMDSMRAQEPLLLADRDYLKAMAAGEGAQRKALLESAAKNYRAAVKANIGIVFRYYVPDPIAQQVLPPGVSRADVDRKELTEEQMLGAYVNAMNLIAHGQYDPDAEDRGEYQRYIDRAMVRLKGMGGPEAAKK
jgi:hypothetical protein